MGKKIKIVTVIAAVFLVSYVVVDQVSRWHRDKVDEAVEQEREKWKIDMDALKQEVAILKGESEPHEPLPEENNGVYGENRKIVPRVDKIDLSGQNRATVDTFFKHLDEQGYLEKSGLTGTTYGFFAEVMGDLAETPPVVADERATTLRLMRNMAHFYRVLGEKRTLLIARILANESENMEETLYSYHNLAFGEGRDTNRDLYRPSPETAYEYAGFFLNTLGGKSYLTRRESRLRILASYYSVLVLDMANREKLNQYGIDIRPHLKMLESDLKNYRGLSLRKHYLKTITRLREQYL